MVSKKQKTVKNPAIDYKKEIELLLQSPVINAKKYDELYKKCLKECTHTDEKGSSAWTQLSEDLSYCPYCGLSD